MIIQNIVNLVIADLVENLDKNELLYGEIIYNNNGCQILSQSSAMFELIVDNEIISKEYRLVISDSETIAPSVDREFVEWDRYSYACLLQVENELCIFGDEEYIEHKKYSKEGMIKRVIQERRVRAQKANYRIDWAANLYGNHIITNERGVKYKVFLRDFENELGYSDSMDSKLNKLGTTKHIMYAFNYLEEHPTLKKRLSKTFPFIEIFADPLNDYRITWYCPREIQPEEKLLISKYFKDKNFIEETEVQQFLGFIDETEGNSAFCVRPEVPDIIERAYESAMLKELSQSTKLEYDFLSVKLFDYQKTGVEFSVFRKAAIIADEMGLGKTMQAISTAILKKQIFDFKKTLIICPASIKEQWKNEIEKFTGENALVIQGTPNVRKEQYKDENHFFLIVNYETVLRDHTVINKAGIDFLILDEAQRVKNYETQTASPIKRLQPRHILVITGTPIENKLIDIFSIISIIDPYFLGPLWEFSYQHCVFDVKKHNKINGYYDLQKLNHRLEDILIRREKRKVMEQLPNLSQTNIPVQLSPLQQEYHGSYGRAIAQILGKKYFTPFDLQRMQMLLSKMRMVCDSTYLVDAETNESPKLEELKYVLLEKLDVKNSTRKIIIFSEWVKSLKIIGKMLREAGIGFVELSGKIPVKFRGELIKKFETNENYKVFLSTEAGGSGLNLQVADTVINFELPWNPAKKNQRIGRIDRLGQRSDKLTVLNFITQNSIEEKIATGLLVKQNLFDGVLDSSSSTNFVDFSSKGRSQFIEELELFVTETINSEVDVEEDESQISTESQVETIKETSENSASPVVDVSESEEEKPEKGNITEKESTTSNEHKPEVNSENLEQKEKAKELEQVMNSGMQFLSGLFKMSTGKDAGFENQKIEINEKTGEVTMKFKLPL